MPVLIKPTKMWKKRWFLPALSTGAIITLIIALIGTFVLLGIQIYNSSYTEPDKKWSDLIALTTPLIATFTVIGGAISWLSVLNEKRRRQLVDVAETSLIVYYDPYTYLYDVSISLADNAVIKDVVHVVELYSNKGKVVARQLISASELRASSHHKIKINDVARRFHIGFNDIGAVNSYLIYRSSDFYWRLSSINNKRFRLIEPRVKPLRSNGSFGYFKNTVDELKENTERGVF